MTVSTPQVIYVTQNGREVEFRFVGYGAYPYPCGHSQRHPQAAVYVSEETGGWLCEHDSAYANARKA